MAAAKATDRKERLGANKRLTKTSFEFFTDRKRRRYNRRAIVAPPVRLRSWGFEASWAIHNSAEKHLAADSCLFGRRSVTNLDYPEFASPVSEKRKKTHSTDSSRRRYALNDGALLM
ncbi:hypothetical protein, partial [Rhodopirellula sallentina]|uniref:hypothetical protein n=1 Tax=Rhodopirellula sallentina TaxID=1263869 RepID=UPI001F478E96